MGCWDGKKWIYIETLLLLYGCPRPEWLTRILTLRDNEQIRSCDIIFRRGSWTREEPCLNMLEYSVWFKDKIYISFYTVAQYKNIYDRIKMFLTVQTCLLQYKTILFYCEGNFFSTNIQFKYSIIIPAQMCLFNYKSDFFFIFSRCIIFMVQKLFFSTKNYFAFNFLNPAMFS